MDKLSPIQLIILTVWYFVAFFLADFFMTKVFLNYNEEKEKWKKKKLKK
jgi:hypothetical protein